MFHQIFLIHPIDQVMEIVVPWMPSNEDQLVDVFGESSHETADLAVDEVVDEVISDAFVDYAVDEAVDEVVGDALPRLTVTQIPETVNPTYNSQVVAQPGSSSNPPRTLRRSTRSLAPFVGRRVVKMFAGVNYGGKIDTWCASTRRVRCRSAADTVQCLITYNIHRVCHKRGYLDVISAA